MSINILFYDAIGVHIRASEQNRFGRMGWSIGCFREASVRRILFNCSLEHGQSCAVGKTLITSFISIFGEEIGGSFQEARKVL